MEAPGDAKEWATTQCRHLQRPLGSRRLSQHMGVPFRDPRNSQGLERDDVDSIFGLRKMFAHVCPVYPSVLLQEDEKPGPYGYCPRFQRMTIR